MEGIVTPPPETPVTIESNNMISKVQPVIAEFRDSTALIGPIASTSNSNVGIRGNTYETDILKEIIMPGPVRVRGRPKGAVLTTIGLKLKEIRGKLLSNLKPELRRIR